LSIYADTSLFVSLYTIDSRSAASRELIKSASGVWFTPLHHAEWTDAISQQVFHGKATTAEVEQFHRHLENDRAAGLWIEVEMPDHVYDRCADLARKFGPRLGTRTLASLHVACALELKAEQFWTFDERQAKLAKVVGLRAD
jgi:predicted nucleic acid-binding protein